MKSLKFTRTPQFNGLNLHPNSLEEIVLRSDQVIFFAPKPSPPVDSEIFSCFFDILHPALRPFLDTPRWLSPPSSFGCFDFRWNTAKFRFEPNVKYQVACQTFQRDHCTLSWKIWSVHPGHVICKSEQLNCKFLSFLSGAGVLCLLVSGRRWLWLLTSPSSGRREVEYPLTNDWWWQQLVNFVYEAGKAERYECYT